MESTIDAMSNEYDEFVAAATEVIKARAESGRKTVAGDAALEKFSQRWELFKASCDRAEEAVDSARKRIAAERVTDVASGMAPAQPGAAGSTRSVSLPRLEGALRAMDSLAADLCRGSDDATAAAASSPGPSDVMPSVDKAD